MSAQKFYKDILLYGNNYSKKDISNFIKIKILKRDFLENQE